MIAAALNLAICRNNSEIIKLLNNLKAQK